MVATANDIESLPPELMRKGRFDVRRHVVGALHGVDVQRIAVWNEPRKEGAEVALHVGVDVLVDDQRRTGVVHEDGAEALGNPRRGDRLLNLLDDSEGGTARTLDSTECSWRRRSDACSESV